MMKCLAKLKVNNGFKRQRQYYQRSKDGKVSENEKRKKKTRNEYDQYLSEAFDMIAGKILQKLNSICEECVRT